jgi:hypothetical protein
MGRIAAEVYFTTFSAIPQLLEDGCPLHPESLIKSSIDARGCESIDRLRAEFTTMRKGGESRSPEISPIDFVHACMG